MYFSYKTNSVDTVYVDVSVSIWSPEAFMWTVRSYSTHRCSQKQGEVLWHVPAFWFIVHKSYNPDTLRIRRANMDIQFINDANGAACYVIS